MTRKFATIAVLFFSVPSCLLLLRGTFLMRSVPLVAGWLLVDSAGVAILFLSYLKLRSLPMDDAIREMVVKLFFLVAFISLGTMIALKPR